MRITLYIVLIVFLYNSCKTKFHHFHPDNFGHIKDQVKKGYYLDTVFSKERCFILRLDETQIFAGSELVRYPDTTDFASNYHYTYLFLTAEGYVYMNTFSRGRDTIADQKLDTCFQHLDALPPKHIKLKKNLHNYAKHGMYKILKPSKVKWNQMDKHLYRGKNHSNFIEIELENKSVLARNSKFYVLRSHLIETGSHEIPDTLHVLDLFAHRKNGPISDARSAFNGAKFYEGDEIFNFDLKFVEIKADTKLDF